ncbi:MAG: GNAT family N-acetyltransferase [Candidatus Cloacimonetes bacterium]|nr:GNAT family N-acetyltransferase [Candidatus Cloacimonadota bacterium]
MPHVQEYWGEVDKWDDFFQNFKRSLELNESEQFLVNYQNKPFAFIQYYWASKVDNGWWTGYGDDVIGLDLYIANIELLAQGHGSLLLKEFISSKLKPLNVRSVICDPKPSNQRAITCFEKVGFHPVNEIATPDGVAFLMQMKL